VKNRLVRGTIVGQAVVTLVAIGYGVSAHSSWEAEHQRRIDGERAAVAEMATAMKSARERLDKVEQELKRCQAQAGRTARGPRPTPPPSVTVPAGVPARLALSTEEAPRLLTAWCEAPVARETSVGSCPAAPAQAHGALTGQLL
jgi:hypothetical protein